MATLTLSDEFSRCVIEGFCDFIQHTTDVYLPGTHLEHYIAYWLEEGPGVGDTGGDFTTYLEAVLLIIYTYEQDPSILNYAGDRELGLPPRERQVTGLLNLEAPGRWCFDRRSYNQLAYGRLQGVR